MPASLPQRTRVYQCHHLDSTRWDDLIPRPDDIVITTSLKAGTTWTQRIVSLLVFQSVELPMTLHFCSPWVDSRFVGGRTELLRICEALEHRRFFKSHLPLDALPYRGNDEVHLRRPRYPRRVHVDVEPHSSLHGDGARDAERR